MSVLLQATDEAEALEDLHALGCTDGLPVVIPTAERVARMVLASGLDADLVLGDMTRFDLNHKFDGAFCTFNTFRHLLTEQDAVDHLRHIETLATAATARALAQMAKGERIEESERVLAQARDSVKSALDNVTELVAKLGPQLASGKQDGAGGKG